MGAALHQAAAAPDPRPNIPVPMQETRPAQQNTSPAQHSVACQPHLLLVVAPQAVLGVGVGVVHAYRLAVRVTQAAALAGHPAPR